MLKLTSQKVAKFRLYLFAIVALSPGIMARVFPDLVIVQESAAGQFFIVAAGFERLLYAVPIAAFAGALGALIALQMAWTQIDDSDTAAKKSETDAKDARASSKKAYDEYTQLHRELLRQKELGDERQAEIQKQWLELGEAQRAHEGRARHLATQIADQQRKNEKPRRNDRSGGGSQNSNPNPKPY